LLKLSVANLTHLFLRFGYDDPENHNWNPLSALRSIDNGVDFLSLALQAITQAPKLRSFQFHRFIVLSPDFFWPQDQLDDDTKKVDSLSDSKGIPHWPSLEEFYIHLSIVAPDGSWLYEAPASGPEDSRPSTPDVSEPSTPSSDSDVPDDDYTRYEEYESGMSPQWLFRKEVRRKPFEVWVKSMIRATEEMPKLRKGLLHLAPWHYSDESYADVLCRQANGAHGRDWEIQLGREAGNPVSDELIHLLQSKIGPNENITIHVTDKAFYDDYFSWEFTSGAVPKSWIESTGGL
jgi:hypothetical protein